MEMHVGVINNYNNLIQIATDDMEVGINTNVNMVANEVEPEPEVNELSETNKQSVINNLNKENPLLTEPETAEPEEFLLAESEPLTHDEKKIKFNFSSNFNRFISSLVY